MSTRTDHGRRIDLSRSTSVVTGAGGGIGAATALALGARGSRIVATDLDGSSARATADRCHAAGVVATSHELDVTNPGEVFAFARHIEEELGPVSVLVNSAGVGLSGRFLDMGASDWDWIVEVNLKGVVNSCAAFAPSMLTAGEGHVVNLCSALAHSYSPTEPAYAATKAAVFALSQCLRADWRPSGVSVSVISPGVINTGIVERARFLGAEARPERRQKAAEMFGRGREPELVASTILRAIERDMPMATVGTDGRLAWFTHRALPLRLREWLSSHAAHR